MSRTYSDIPKKIRRSEDPNGHALQKPCIAGQHAVPCERMEIWEDMGSWMFLLKPKFIKILRNHAANMVISWQNMRFYQRWWEHLSNSIWVNSSELTGRPTGFGISDHLHIKGWHHFLWCGKRRSNPTKKKHIWGLEQTMLTWFHVCVWVSLL